MATVVPDVLPSRATEGEKRLLKLLEKLPDEVVLYYEAKIRNRHADVVLIDPKVGILVFEVKGWRAGDIKQADPDNLEVQYYGNRQVTAHPLKQVRDYVYRLVDEMKLHPQTRRFWPEGRCSFPYAWMVVLTSTNRRLLHKNFGSVADEVFPADRVLTQDELDEMELLAPEGLRDYLRKRFDPWWEFQALTSRDMDSIRAWLHPEAVISAEVEASARVQEEFADSWGKEEIPLLKILDLQQESHACRIGDGHRILSGVAGSGKTSILIARAKLVYDHVPHARVLFLCYNRFLADHLRSVLGKRKIEVWNFHKWTGQLGVSWYPEIDEAYWRQRTLDVLRMLPEEQRYDFVLVDEAQDFEADWLLAARLALKDPENGDLLLAGDGCQNLYRKKFKWSSVGIKAAGRVIGERFNLQRNYRNSREIVALAAAAMPEEEGALEEGEGLASKVAAVELAPRGSGVFPVLWKCGSREAECEGALGLISLLLKGEWPEAAAGRALRPEEMAILYPKKIEEKLILKLKHTLDVNGIACTWLSRPKEKSRYLGENAVSQGVRIQTIHSAKGLQYRAVILIWADSLAMMNLDDEREAQLLYVACTRAEDYLGILYSRETEMMERVKTSGVALVLEGEREKAKS